MELRDFVKESLVQISKGIEEANNELSDSQAMVNPLYLYLTEEKNLMGRTTHRDPEFQDPDSKLVQRIEFDVAVVVQDSVSGGGKASLSIASIGFGEEGKKDMSNKSESRIKFAIPMVFPGFDNSSE